MGISVLETCIMISFCIVYQVGSISHCTVRSNGYYVSSIYTRLCRSYCISAYVQSQSRVIFCTFKVKSRSSIIGNIIIIRCTTITPCLKIW